MGEFMATPGGAGTTRVDEALRATAYHEAGHAVVAHHLGFDIPKSLTVIGTGDWHGRVDWSPSEIELEGGRLHPATRDLVERVVMQILAGPWAEERFTGRLNLEGGGLHKPDTPVIDADGTQKVLAFVPGSDFWKAHDLIAYISASEEATTEHLGRLERRVRNMLADPVVWHRITVVAGAAAERGTLTRTDLAELMKAATDDPQSRSDAG